MAQAPTPVAPAPARPHLPDWTVFLAATLLIQGVAQAVAALFGQRAVIEVSRVDFLVVTGLLAGSAAWLTGRAIAGSWRPYWHAAAYMVLFALFVRWVHFALFRGTLLSLHYYLIDLVVVLALATLGYRQVRVRQMTRQYRWLYERAGLLGWRRITAGP